MIVSSTVALRKESVDRNIYSLFMGADFAPVALRKESVDRNITGWPMQKNSACRSPQGERG